MRLLVADRFVCRMMDVTAARSAVALDLATGWHVRLRFGEAGSRREQEEWLQLCVRACDVGALVDFGLIGRSRRFEATSTASHRRPLASAAPFAHVLDWLERRKPSSAGILSLCQLPDPRQLRVRGFVPMSLALSRDACIRDVWPLLAGRSVVLLASSRSSAALAFAFLDSRRAGVRDVTALAQRNEGREVMVRNAAEGRAAYHPHAETQSIGRADVLLAQGERLFAAGRHAAAERALRGAGGAFHRRGDRFRTGAAAMLLGRLLMTRGRAESARASFEAAYHEFQHAGAGVAGINATIHLAMAEADLGRMVDAERSCRAAHSAAAALNDRRAGVTAAIALARALTWSQRYSEAEALLESFIPDDAALSRSLGVFERDDELIARYWCLVARIHLAADRHAQASRALEHVRRPGQAGCAAIESLVRRWEAAVQARVGDLKAIEMHVTAGVAAARAAHLPLRAVKMRLVLVDGLIDAGQAARARSAARHLLGLRQAIPPLLETSVKRTLARLEGTSSERATAGSRPAARETAVPFQLHTTSALGDLERVADLLTCSHQFDDEAQALSRAAVSIQKHLHAISVGIFGQVNREARLFGSAGTCDAGSARRCVDAGLSIGPEPARGWVDAALPIRYLGRCIGALAIRWAVEGPDHQAHAMTFGAAAAGVCAPLVYLLVERESAPAPTAGPSSALIGVSPAMEPVRHAIARAANAPFTVLVEGESGAGKELVARAIHSAGSRRERRFCAFNCAAMAEDLVDTELFGHTKGAFTGAATERLGLFESADHGTVFLDEVGELSARAQAKILRVLQEGEVRRIGENFSRPFDARLIAATNRSLRVEVEAGRFRQDLLYRLDVIRIRVPPLRERVDDIPLLAAKFWRQAADRIGSKAVLGQHALAALARYDWPGNVRELQNVLTALVVTSPPRGVVGVRDMPAAIARATPPDPQESLESARLKFEQRFVRAALARSAGNRGQTAAALGLSRQGLAKLMQRLHLDA